MNTHDHDMVPVRPRQTTFLEEDARLVKSMETVKQRQNRYQADDSLPFLVWNVITNSSDIKSTARLSYFLTAVALVLGLVVGIVQLNMWAIAVSFFCYTSIKFRISALLKDISQVSATLASLKLMNEAELLYYYVKRSNAVIIPEDIENKLDIVSRSNNIGVLAYAMNDKRTPPFVVNEIHNVLDKLYHYPSPTIPTTNPSADSRTNPLSMKFTSESEVLN